MSVKYATIHDFVMINDVITKYNSFLKKLFTSTDPPIKYCLSQKEKGASTINSFGQTTSFIFF